MELDIEDLEEIKEGFNREWRDLIKEINRREDTMYDKLEREGKYKNTCTLDGPIPPEVQAIEDEYKQKLNDILRRYRETVKRYETEKK